VAAERALYGLGIFSDVDVSLVPGTPEAAGRDVMIRVEEGRRRRFSYGAGFDSEDGLRGLLGLAYGNLFGRAIHARADLLASQRDQEVRLQVQQPYVWRRAVPLTYSLFGLEESRESYDSLRYAAQVGVERIRDGWRLGLVAAWERVELELLEPIEPLDIDRRLQDARIFSLTPSAFLDRRDDPVEPTSGWSTSALAEIAIPALGGEADFVKLFDQLSAYRGLGRLGVVAVTLRAGAIEPGNDGEPSAEPRIGETSELVPISERFFGGGSASHRAYELDTLGIVGETLLLCPSEGQVVVEPDGDVRPATCGDPLASDDPGRLLPVGGNGLLLASLDWRFPIVGDFGGTVFADAGNVWADWRDVDPREAKLGVGAGARYRTPVGPVRLDIAWKLDREPQEDPYQVFLSFGYAF
jgi:outer membrane protein assembly factor BamA